MPRLSELTDYDPMGNFVGAQPVAASNDVSVSTPLSNNVDKILNSIFRPDEKRLQLWPERLVREGITAAGDVASGKVPTMAIDPATGDVHTSPQMIEKAQQISALAGTGGLGGAGGSLNATPSLRPALKYKEKLYKGKPGQEHMDVIPANLYPEFQKMAMSGEDISHYNFGFVNDKGHFLNREDALKYGIDNGLIDPQAGKFGALTSTLFSDSSKPGVAIEAMKKSITPEIDALIKAGDRNALQRMNIDDLDRAAYGFAEGDKTTLNPKDIKIIYKDDLLNPQDKFKKGGMDWVKSVDHSEPAKVSINQKGEIVLEDGHHRWFAANKLNKPLPVEFERIKGKPIEKLLDSDLHKKLSKLKSDTANPLPPGYELKPIEYDPFEQKT